LDPKEHQEAVESIDVPLYAEGMAAGDPQRTRRRRRRSRVTLRASLSSSAVTIVDTWVQRLVSEKMKMKAMEALHVRLAEDCMEKKRIPSRVVSPARPRSRTKSVMKSRKFEMKSTTWARLTCPSTCSYTS